MTAALPLWASLPATLLLIAGGLLVLIGSFGLLRLRDFYARMHPPTMGATLGAGCVFVASMLVSSALADRAVVHELLLALFVVLTAPISAMLIVRAALYRSGGRKAGGSADAAPRGGTDDGLGSA